MLAKDRARAAARAKRVGSGRLRPRSDATKPSTERPNVKETNTVVTMLTLLVGGGLGACSEAPAPDASRGSVAALLEAYAPEPLVFDIDSKEEAAIQGVGTSFVIPGGTIYEPGGQPADVDTDGDGKLDARTYYGRVKVTLRELLTPEDMMNAGRPTVTMSGDLLESGGAFDLELSAGDRALQVIELRDLTVTPQQQPSTTEGMELWVADPAADRFGWIRPAAEPMPATPNGESFSVPVAPARIWPSKNIDRPVRVNWPPTPRLFGEAPLRVRVAGDDIDDAAVFFFPKGLFSVIALQREASSDGWVFSSPGRTMSALGTEGTLLAVSRSGGATAIYRDQVELTAQAAASQVLEVRPSPVSQRALAHLLSAQ